MVFDVGTNVLTKETIILSSAIYLYAVQCCSERFYCICTHIVLINTIPNIINVYYVPTVLNYKQCEFELCFALYYLNQIGNI